MANNKLENLMNSTMDNIRQMVDVNTIIGEPVICPDGTVIIPVSKVSYGFASGGSDLPPKINTQKELDSMTFIYLMCKLEEEFHIEIPEKKWVNFKTLGDVIDEIERVI